MRLKSVSISDYKNLKNFSLSFDTESLLDIFVGKNGSGKSNLLEALIEIFHHLFESSKAKKLALFDYSIEFEIDSQSVEVAWSGSVFSRVSVNGKKKSIADLPLPENILVYYSGQNDAVTKLLRRYEEVFQSRIKGASVDESRRFIGIGPEYKTLLLAVLLLQPEACLGRQYIYQRLGIKSMEPVIQLVLQRPKFATGRFKELDCEKIDHFDTRTHFWGATGVTKDFLEKIMGCVKGEFNHGDIYASSQEEYYIPINVSLYQQEFSDAKHSEQFQMLDNLKTLGMLKDIRAIVHTSENHELSLGGFSDGQLQSVYIYSITELFKDRNCITLLDEPDSFLHPEWQFDFLKQVFEITDTAAKSNHVLMSSHSAVTLIPHDNKKIKFFDLKDNQTNCYDLPKSIAIKKLSADLIKYSEQEQLLSIINAIQIEKKPVLFTEGSTDPIILKEAWYKLYDEEMPFIPFYAFSCTYIKQLLTDNRIHAEMGGLPVFALFDFDKAYDQWNGLNGTVSENDPMRGLIKKWVEGESYALMLPVPANADIQRQVIRNAATGETFGGDSCCEIEHLFYGLDATKDFYQQEPCAGGSKIVFISDHEKTAFAKDVVPTLDPACFESFRPMFEFVKSKCPAI